MGIGTWWQAPRGRHGFHSAASGLDERRFASGSQPLRLLIRRHARWATSCGERSAARRDRRLGWGKWAVPADACASSTDRRQIVRAPPMCPPASAPPSQTGDQASAMALWNLRQIHVSEETLLGRGRNQTGRQGARRWRRPSSQVRADRGCRRGFRARRENRSARSAPVDQAPVCARACDGFGQSKVQARSFAVQSGRPHR